MNNKKLIEYFEQFITPERRERMEDVLNKRTKYITIVLEDIYQSHNISAVLRSCDCFGINDIHLIENEHKFIYNKEIGMGAINWLSIYRYNQNKNNTQDAVKKIKKSGYRIIATSPVVKNNQLNSFDLNKGPTAIFFGTELTGLSHDLLELCDEYLYIPLYGFTESLNISVSAAIIINHLYTNLIHSDISWQLSEKEKDEIKIQWLRNSVKNSEKLEKMFHSGNNIE